MSRFSRFAVITLVLLTAFSLYAANDVGTPVSHGQSIEWQLKVNGHSSVSLAVLAPDGERYDSEFGAGKNPTFSLRDLADIEDGQYSWELSVTPNINASVKGQLAAARAANDHAAAKAIQKKYGLDKPQSQSGHFIVRDGSIVSFNATEPTAKDAQSRFDDPSSQATSGTGDSRRPNFTPAVQDQVIPDDLIVQGSTCTGLDCVNNENFGFDTLRLKENNLRIHFDDTSTSAGFPANDWRLVANDSASGGANKFSIEDSTASRNPFTIEAGAPANGIFLDSSGNVGLQTSAPALDFHISSTDTPAIRLEQTNAGGFTAQTWDVAGNEANFFVRDVTSGSRLPFRIRPGAPTSSLDISSDGDVGIGTGSPSADLDISSGEPGTGETLDAFFTMGVDATAGPSMNIGYGGASFGRSSAFINMRPDASAVAPNPSLRFLTENILALIIDDQQFLGIGGIANPAHPIHHNNGAHLTAAGVWTSVSSREAKDNIIDLSPDAAFAALKELKPVTYTYKVDPTDPQVGFVAEDVPDIVAQPDHKTLNALEIVGVLTKVVQEQQKTIDELSQRLAELEEKKN